MMTACRAANPNLILLTHRVNLGKAAPFTTPTLWEGTETYIDVWMPNRTSAPHHRAGALSRGLPPDLNRLVEDHGVCLSSCLDYWEDDVVLQAFNRSLLLAPEVYGNSWLLRDDEFPRLARFFNLHRRYNDLLTHGMVLPQAHYGPNAVSRGNGTMRLLTLRNLTWNPAKYTVKLDNEIGLSGAGEAVMLRQFHPVEHDLGTFAHGSTVEVEVPPFRPCLLMVSTRPIDELGVSGCDYEVVRDTPGKPALVKLLGLPGSRTAVKLLPGTHTFVGATLDGQRASSLLRGQSVAVTFPGQPIPPLHQKLADLKPVEVPTDAEALYEASCFAADNNALEVRQLARSGPTKIPAVEAARKAFFEQADFKSRGVWDRNMFDGDPNTAFKQRDSINTPGAVAALRLDLGAPTQLDRLTLAWRGGTVPQTAEVSSDLRAWTPATLQRGQDMLTMQVATGPPIRYVRLTPAPTEVSEVNGYRGQTPLDRSRWRGSNIFRAYASVPATAAWSAAVTLPPVPRGSYLCIALNGKHGVEGAYAAVRVAGQPVGAPDRAVSYLCNPWEHEVQHTDSNYTYYVPVTPNMIGKPLDVVALTLRGGQNEYKPEVWITTYPTPYATHLLELTPPGISRATGSRPN